MTHTVSGLTNGTDYQFKVRAVNASGNGAESEASTATQPAAPTLTAGTITATGATLTIGNYTPAWHYKQTAPSAGTCSSAISSLSTTVGSLTANTSYTFKAYSDSTCSTEIAAASAFPTLPPKPATPTATAGSSRQLTISSSLTGGNATLTRWEYKKKDSAWDNDWTHHLQHLEDPLPHGIGPHQRHRLPVQGARGERLRRRGGVRSLDGGGADRRVAHRERYHRHRRNAHHRQPHERLVLQAHDAEQRAVLDGHLRHIHHRRQPHGEHLLHLRGLQRQRLRDASGHGIGLPHAAAEARHAHRDGQSKPAAGSPSPPRSPAAAPRNHPLGVQEARRQYLGQQLDDHHRDLHLAQPRPSPASPTAPATSSRCER